ncbi:hypothetical protein N7490_008023 [Penicillium lividum]|nr:hypothetical protein N7490_008023 [Penicillium lividum]
MSTLNLSPQLDGWILIVSLMQHLQLSFEEAHPHLMSILKEDFDIRTMNRPHQILKHLEDSPDRETPLPDAVFIVDKGPLLAIHHPVWDGILEYVRKGGFCITMGDFSLCKHIDDAFFVRTGLPWRMGRRHRMRVTLNQGATDAFLDGDLEQFYDMEGKSIQNVGSDDCLYNILPMRKNKPSLPGETTVAMGRVGDGWLGYVGDVNLEKESCHVIYGMCVFMGYT